jgi:hypothetical protein
VLRLLCDRRDALSRAHPGPGPHAPAVRRAAASGGAGEEVRRPVPGAAGRHPAP